MKNILSVINIGALFLSASLLCIDNFDQKLERAIKNRRINVTYENGDRILALNPVVLGPNKNITYDNIVLLGSAAVCFWGCTCGIIGIMCNKGEGYKVFAGISGSLLIGSTLLIRENLNNQWAEDKNAIEVVNHHFVCLQQADNQRK